MSCKGCQGRKRSILRWLGLDAVLTDFGKRIVKHIETQVRKLQFSDNRLEEKIRKLESDIKALTDKVEGLEFPGFKKPEG